MKTLIFLAFALLICFNAFAQHSDKSLCRTRIISKEQMTITGSITLEIEVLAYDTCTLDSIRIMNDVSFFSVSYNNNTTSSQGISSPSFSATYLLPGETATCVITVMHSTQNLPYYPEAFGLLISSHKDDEISKNMALCKVYFTPYNSVEVWDKKDFSRLPRVWAARVNPAPQRVFISRNTIPVSTKPAVDIISYDWQKYYQVARVPGLPYLIQMAAVHPDTIKYYKNKDSIEVWQGLHGGQLGKSLFGNTFSGSITGRLRANYVPDEQNNAIDIGLEGVLVAAYDEDLTYDDNLGHTHTNANGEFTISYSSWQSSLEGENIELFVQYWSENLIYDIEVEIDPYWQYVPVLFNVAPETGYTWIGDVGTSYNGNIGNINIENIYDGAFKTLNWAYKAYKFSKDNLGSLSDEFTRSLDILTESNMADNTSAFFNTFYGNRINLARNSDLHEGTIWHEFGHFLMHQLQNGYSPGNTGGTYDRWGDAHINRAWSEGWADGFAMMCDVYYWYYDNESFFRRTGFFNNSINYEQRTIQNATNGFKSVYQIGCTILDLYDGPGKFLNIPSIEANFYNDGNTNNGYKSVTPNEQDDVSLSFEVICKAMLFQDHVGQFYTELLNQQTDICMLNKIKTTFTLNGITNPVNSYTDGNHQLNTDPLYTTVQIDGSNFNLDIDQLNGSVNNYNFGSTINTNSSMVLTDQLTVTNGAKLSFNSNENTGFGTGQPPLNGSLLSVQACNKALIINNSSSLIIGGSNQTSTVTIKTGTSLILRSGSMLEVKNNSTLIIESGARLIFEKNAAIKLLDLTSTLIIKHGAKIQIGKDAIFNYKGDGFIRFETAYPVSTSIEAIGPNAQFKLVGGAFGSTSKKIMEITGGETLADLTTNSLPAATYNLALFSVQNGHIELSAGSRIVVSGYSTKADFRSLDIRAAKPNTLNERHRGLVINGQSGNVVYKVSVSDAITGIQSNNIYGGADVDILQYNATRCITALDIKGTGARIQDAEINNCITAIKLEGMSRSTRLYRTKLYYNTNGVYAINCVNNVVELYQPNIYNNYYGLYGYNSQFSAVCGVIKNNASSIQTNGVYLGANVYLTQKSNLILDPVMRIGAGKVDMGNVISVAVRQASAAYGPHINQSGSSLLTDIDYSITGTLVDRARIFSPYATLSAKNNLWGYTNGTSRSPIQSIDYNTTYKYNIPPFISSTRNLIVSDVTPISSYSACGAGGSGGSGGDDRMRGWIAGEVTPIKDLPNKTIPDGRMLKETVQEGYNQFFDLVPNYPLAISNLTISLNTDFTEEDLDSWGISIPQINSQLIEALGEGIAEGGISKFNADNITYSELVQEVINLQDKLLNDFINDSQNVFVISIAKAALLRMLDNREESIQVLNNISNDLYPDLNNIKESFLCMTKKEKLMLEGSILTYEYDSLYDCSNFEDFSELPPPYMELEGGGELSRKNNNGQSVFASNPISVYPNPTSGLFTLTFKGEEATHYQIDIMDIMGKKVSSFDGIFLRDNKVDFSLAQEPSGIYFIKITSGKEVQVNKLILTK